MPCRWQGGAEFAPTHFWPRHEMRWVVSVTPRPRFTPGTHWIGGWVGLRSGLDTETRRKKSFASAGDRTSIVRPVVRYYAMWRIQKTCPTGNQTSVDQPIHCTKLSHLWFETSLGKRSFGKPRKWKVAGTSLGPCPMVGFGISIVELSVYT
jgi:hypothetical protein